MIKEYGYEYDATLDEQLWEHFKDQVTYETLDGALCLRSGRDALKVIAREFENTIVYLPALACDSMILPFEMYGHTVCFYRLTQNYSIDLEYLVSLISENQKKGLFLYMDYFGVESISDIELVSLSNRFANLVFIEDRTHNLLNKCANVFMPDFIVASLRKWINIPDGALLWCNIDLKNKAFSEDTSFTKIRLNAQCMRRKYFETGNKKLKEEYRKIFSTVSKIMDTETEPARMSAYSYELVKRADWTYIKSKRFINTQKLVGILRGYGIKLIQPKAGNSDLYVAFIVEDRDSKQKLLSQIGIFNTIIWPLTDIQKETCQVARYTEEHMLAAPCDQRYSVDDMKYIGEEIGKIFGVKQ